MQHPGDQCERETYKKRERDREKIRELKRELGYEKWRKRYQDNSKMK